MKEANVCLLKADDPCYRSEVEVDRFSVTPLEPDEADLAFRPSLIKHRYSEFINYGFNEFESYCRTYNLTRSDLTSYFLEQFAKKNLVGFEYHFETTDDGSVNMVSTHYEQSGDVCDSFARARDERRLAGLDSSREEAELEGVRKIKSELLQEGKDATVLLVSRPPEKNQNRPGYAGYSFIYFGKYDTKTGNLPMYAWRNYMTVDEQNELRREFLGFETEKMKDANDFLRNPAFSFGEEGNYAFDRLRFRAGKEVADLYDYRSEVVDRAAKELVDLAEAGVSDWRMNIAQANIELDFIEAIEGKRSLKLEPSSKTESFKSDAEAYGYMVARKKDMESKYNLASYSGGGCGRSIFASVGGEAEGAIGLIPTLAISDLHLNGREYSANFNCPKCNGKIISGRGITTCPHCGFTKEQAAKEMGIAC